MPLREVLTKFLKSIGADTRAGLVQYILVALILAMGGLSALYKRTRDVSIQILTTPVPLWATILLVLLAYLYSRIKLKKRYSSHITSTFEAPMPNTSLRYRIDYFTVDDYKWKALIYQNGSFDVDKYPICLKHDLHFLFDSLSKTYKCPERDKKNCYSSFSWLNHEKIYDTAKSYIEKEIRNNPNLLPKPPASQGRILSKGVIE